MQEEPTDPYSRAMNLLKDMESVLSELLDSLKEKTSIETPNVVVTMNDIKEDPDSNVPGRYDPSSETILLNYRADLSNAMHLYSHHIQLVRLGATKYIYISSEEGLRLPWVMRRLEREADHMSTLLIGQLNPRVKIQWESDWRAIAKSLDRIKAMIEFKRKWNVNYDELRGSRSQ
ncbi:hypothetical protein GCM10007981_14280 [Thermocladium modestius]|uniref:Uncharacterized protein n=1 Tax=Thermocladium modestius TaxID=62609 RepID=A0A830GWS5_9CREN|nr:hypothetical protein [Thermocladium modestius]GGP21642.1 hypothetical protein GCM10007981_14280 [Thermocladium modestius]